MQGKVRVGLPLGDEGAKGVGEPRGKGGREGGVREIIKRRG